MVFLVLVYEFHSSLNRSLVHFKLVYLTIFANRNQNDCRELAWPEENVVQNYLKKYGFIWFVFYQVIFEAISVVC
jgi:hypothetical protein